MAEWGNVSSGFVYGGANAGRKPRVDPLSMMAIVDPMLLKPATRIAATEPGPILPVVADTLVAGESMPGLNRKTAHQFGYTGNCCSSCGSYQMVRNGTCEKCENCGGTSGCS